MFLPSLHSQLRQQIGSKTVHAHSTPQTQSPLKSVRQILSKSGLQCQYFVCYTSIFFPILLPKINGLIPLPTITRLTGRGIGATSCSWPGCVPWAKLQTVAAQRGSSEKQWALGSVQRKSLLDSAMGLEQLPTLGS